MKLLKKLLLMYAGGMLAILPVSYAFSQGQPVAIVKDVLLWPYFWTIFLGI
jgi:hypothetical protein